MRWLDISEQERAKRSRWARCLRYALFATGGVLLLIYPLRVALETTTAAYTYLGAGALLSGGVFSALGSAFDRWSGEAVGLPLLFVAFGLFGLVLVVGGSLAATAIGLIFLGVALGVVDRWLTTMYMLRLAKREASSEH